MNGDKLEKRGDCSTWNILIVEKKIVLAYG